MHTDDHLYHQIIAAHHDRDRKAARHLTPRSGRGAQARLGIVNPMTRDIATLLSRPTAALATLAATVLRPLTFVRARSTVPCCAADCG